MNNLSKGILLSFLFISTAGFAQNLFGPMLIGEIKAIGGDIMPDGDVGISDFTVFRTQLEVTLFDTADISKIHVLLKRSAGSPDDLLVQSYDFNTVYTGTDNLEFDLGSYTRVWRCYAEVRVEKRDGTLSKPYTIIYIM